MPTDKRAKIEELFHTAADLPAGEQQRFLDRACGNDAEVRHEVESLLAADRSGGEGIAAALKELAQSLLEADPTIGAHFGPWRVVREIGRGGMGAVYLAVRDDEQFQKQAAIKLLKYGMDTAELARRFRHERQILANLDHPYIARLIDGGSTAEGRLYLVMEYVEGRTISAWRRDANPSVEDCCRLFLKVCEVVSYAHGHLVVHRDLKPGNILITADGSPRLLDFGVAKLLAADTDPSLTATAPAGRPFTPEYASPEQVLGKPVTTASDVYSLGAILYELLTGCKSRRIRPSSPEDVERVVCHTPITRPSHAVPETLPGAARLRRQIAGDLDNIVLMAMRKEPERRYASVDRLAEDVRRSLEGLPVAARKDALWYRTGKFILRHHLALGATALVLLGLLVGMLVAMSEARTAHQARRLADFQRQEAEREHVAAERGRDAALAEGARAESEAQRARTEASRAERRLTELVNLANHSLFDVHAQIERLPGATEARREIVKSTLQYLEELEKDAANNDRLRMAIAAGYLKLGDVQGYPYGASLGDHAGALKSYQHAADLVGPLRRAHSGDPDTLMAWVDIEGRIGLLLDASGNPAAGLARLRSTVADAVTLARLRPGDFEAVQREGALYESISNVLRNRDTAEALVWARRNLDASVKLAARFPEREKGVERLSDAHSQLGALLAVRGDLKGAVAEIEPCIAARETLAAAHPNDGVYERNLMLGYGHLAAVLGNPFMYNLGDSEGARKYYGKSVDIARRIAADDPRNRTAQYDLAASMLRLGAVDVAASGLADALEELRQAAGMLETLMQASPEEIRYKRDWEIAQEYAGHRLRALGRLPEAIAAYRQSLASADSILSTDRTDRPAHAQAMACGRALTVALAMSGDREGALAQARQSIERARAAISLGSDKDVRILYLARGYVALADAYRIFAKAGPASSPAQSQEDWRAARTAAGQVLAELAPVPGAELTPKHSEAIEDARDLIAESDAHIR